MEIEKNLALDAPAAQVWALLLDPNAMAACVPGMESVEVLSADEYLAVMRVKISFISARFKLRTRIVEQQAPNYLRAEGTGEDASVASSLKQVSEMWLAPRADGGTELRMKVQVDVLGRMGTFGLGVMKTKADRIWDEFGVNLRARLAGVAGAPDAAPAQLPAKPETTPLAAAPALPPAASGTVSTAAPVPDVVPVPDPSVAPPGFWARLFGAPQVNVIRVEVRRGDTQVSVTWPVHAAPECVAWLRELMPRTDAARTAPQNTPG